jgi:CysZ protein
MLKEIIIAIRAYFEAHRFIVKNRLWKWMLVPGIVYSVLFVIGFYFFWTSSNSAIEWMLNNIGAKNWIEKMQDSWLSFLFILGQIILHLFLLLFYFSLFKFAFLIIASPAFAYLSEKTESILTNQSFTFNLQQYLIDIVRAIKIAGRNTIWQTVYLISILILSFIPLIGWTTPIIIVLIDCYYLGFSMLDYSSERNKLSATESIQLIGTHKGLAIGNGIVFYALHVIPILGWVCAPAYAVVAATISLHRAKENNVILQ